MAQVKGTILVDFVKTIKADKIGAYDKYLTDEDKQILSSRILPSSWYPYETFKNCFGAVVKVLAKDDMETVRQWGRIYGEAIITSVYKGVVKEGQPMESLDKYRTYVRNMFDFGEFEGERISDNETLLRIKGFDPDFKPIYYMMAGWIERSLELCGAKNIECVFQEKAWEGDPETSIKCTWTL